MAQEPEVNTPSAEEHLANIFGNDLKPPTPEENDRAQENDLEGHEETPHNRIIPDEELGHSSRVLTDEEESRLHTGGEREPIEAADEEEVSDPGSDTEDGEAEIPTDSQMSAREAIEAANGRLREIGRLRQARRAADARHAEQMSELRREILELKEKMSKQEEEEIPEEIRKDPIYGSIDKRLKGMEQAVTSLQPKSDPSTEFTRQEIEEVVSLSTEAVRNFEKVRPDFQEARSHVRNFLIDKFQTSDENFLKAIEIRMAGNWLNAGNDPAAAMYESAIELGWVPGDERGDGQEQEQVQRRENPVKPRKVTRRIQSQVDSPQVHGSETSAPRGQLTRAQFMTQLSDAEQTKILQNEDAFEQLATTGKIDARFIPSHAR